MTILEGLQPIFQGYIAVSFFTTALILYLGYRWDVPKLITGIHAGVSLWTGIATFNYTIGLFSPENTIFLDWIITTPLLVLSLALTAGDGALRNPRDTVLATLAQAAVIVTGYLSVTTGQELYFWIGSLLFATVVYLIMYSIGDISDSSFELTSAVFFLLWAGYPIIFYLGILNEILAPRLVEVGFVILPLASKHLYGLFDMAMLKD